MGFWQSSWCLYTWGGITWDSGNPAGGYIQGNDHMGFWQSSLWLYTWGGITWDSGNQAGGYIQSVSQSVSQKISQSVNQSGVKEEEDLT